MSDIRNLLVLPRLRVQNANAISSPMTWGFPAMSAFVGLMHALERKVAEQDIDLIFQGVGVVCHNHEAQVTNEGFTRAFHLTRNPVDKSGDSASIVEEGRIHLEITLVFAVAGDACARNDEDMDALARDIADIVSGMRIAGGSVVPAPPGRESGQKPVLRRLDDRPDQSGSRFKSFCRYWLPGFALVSRDQLLTRRIEEIRQQGSEATLLDAWLDLAGLNHECRVERTTDEEGETAETVHWDIRQEPGWIVPIPVGYGALSGLYSPGEASRARDDTTPFRFVESLYSVGQWVSPHRLEVPEQLLWYVDNDLESGLYRLNNDFEKHSTTV